MSDNNIKYFSAISENKRKDIELKYQESQIDQLQKKMLTRYWKDKISIFDEMIRLNVKTPTYDSERAMQSYLNEKGGQSAKKYTCSMGPMNIDSKLLSNRPVTLQRGKKGGIGIEPVISIEGNDAVCYPNKEARKGRKVGLNLSVLRRMEQCKALEDSITAIHTRSESDREPEIISFRRNGSPIRRPKTAPKPGQNSKSKSKSRRPETSVARICPAATPVNEYRMSSESPDDRPTTSMSSVKRDWTPINNTRSNTALSFKTGYLSTGDTN